MVTGLILITFKCEACTGSIYVYLFNDTTDLTNGYIGIK